MYVSAIYELVSLISFSSAVFFSLLEAGDKSIDQFEDDNTRRMEEYANAVRSVRRRTNNNVEAAPAGAGVAAAAAAGVLPAAATSSTSSTAAAASILLPPNVPRIPIPNLPPHLHCTGEVHRTIRAPGTSFTGTGVTNSAYFKHHQPSGVLEMRTGVSFLDLKAKISNVPCGKWEATVLIRCDAVNSFQADWSMGSRKMVQSNRSRQQQQQDGGGHHHRYRPFVRFTSQYANDAGGRFLSSHQGKWIRLSFGLVDIPNEDETEVEAEAIAGPKNCTCTATDRSETNARTTARHQSKGSTDVVFRIFGENSWWSRGIWFGDLELRRIRLEWEKEKLLLLCYHRKAGSECQLQDMPREVVRLIGSMII